MGTLGCLRYRCISGFWTNGGLLELSAWCGVHATLLRLPPGVFETVMTLVALARLVVVAHQTLPAAAEMKPVLERVRHADVHKPEVFNVLVLYCSWRTSISLSSNDPCYAVTKPASCWPCRFSRMLRFFQDAYSSLIVFLLTSRKGSSRHLYPCYRREHRDDLRPRHPPPPHFHWHP